MHDERSLPVDGSLFEALFRLAAPEGALGARLLELEVPPDAKSHRFTAQQWLETLKVYRAHLFPGDEADGFRRLGRALASAFGATFSGRLILLALPMLSPLQLLRRWPRFVRVGRTDVELEVLELDPRAVVIVSRDPVNVPMDVNLGLLDYVFEQLGERPRFELAEGADHELRLTVRW